MILCNRVKALRIFITVMIKEAVEPELILLLIIIIVEKTFQSKDRTDSLKNLFNTDQVSSL